MDTDLIFFSIGAFCGLGVLAAIIRWFRVRKGIDNMPGGVALSVWVALAFYCLGAREYYRVDEVLIYVIAGGVLWVLAYLAKRGLANSKVEQNTTDQ